MSAPAYVTSVILVANGLIITALLGGLNLALAERGLNWANRSRVVLSSTMFLLGWFAIALSLSYLDVFRGAENRLPTIQFAILTPIVIGLAFLWRSKSLLNLVDAVPQSWIVGVQTYRVIGAIFIILLGAGHLPPQFAIPAGWGDITVGLLAPLVGLAAARGAIGSNTLILGWNIFGLLDLAIAVGMGFLTSPSPFQILSLEAPNELITAFPLVMVPVFAVPVSVLLHVVSLIKLNRAKSHTVL